MVTWLCDLLVLITSVPLHLDHHLQPQEENGLRMSHSMEEIYPKLHCTLESERRREAELLQKAFLVQFSTIQYFYKPLEKDEQKQTNSACI